MTTWDITVSAPTGDFAARLHIQSIDGQTTGEMSGKNGSGPMQDVVLKNDQLAWSTKIQKPMPMVLKFAGDISGDQIAGTVKFGIFASGTFSGQRAAASATT